MKICKAIFDVKDDTMILSIYHNDTLISILVQEDDKISGDGFKSFFEWGMCNNVDKDDIDAFVKRILDAIAKKVSHFEIEQEMRSDKHFYIQVDDNKLWVLNNGERVHLFDILLHDELGIYQLKNMERDIFDSLRTKTKFLNLPQDVLLNDVLLVIGFLNKTKNTNRLFRFPLDNFYSMA